MNWFKKAQLNYDEIKDHFEKILGLGKYKPNPNEFKKKKSKRDGECQHSMDMHCDGGDDGW